MSRAAFLPSGDPVVLLHSLKYYEEIWHDEVDKLYVIFNSPFNEEIIETLRNVVEALPHAQFEYAPEIAGGGASNPHGMSLTKLTKMATEDYIVFVEDDSIVFKKGMIDKYFKLIENGEFNMIGSPRMSCDARWAEVSKDKFNLNYEGLGDKGPNFWPCFFFCKRSDLLKTDLWFKPRFFEPGEYIKPLDYTVQEGEKMGGDTFVWGSIQMCEITENKVLEIPQYHSMPLWETWYNSNQFIWDGNCYWMHFGSLSSGMENVLLDEFKTPLRNKYMNIDVQAQYPVLMSEQEKQEYEHRFYWWKKAWEAAVLKLANPICMEFMSEYLQAIERGIVALRLDQDRINRLGLAYKEVIGDLL